ncbi:MAG: ABC transporter permease subunit [Acidimicrobiales bacterium]|nr:ABC transporter permease subunit [Acidimicrobiales bacterium]
MIHILAAGTSRTDAQGVGDADSIYDNLILDQWTIPFGSWIDQMVDWTDMNLDWLLDAIKWPFEMLIKYFITEFLVQLPWMWVVLATVIIGSLVRGPKVGITAGLGLCICGLLGIAYWIETCRTIGMVLVSVFLCALVGIPVGVMSGRMDGVWAVVRPILDAMQTVHAFVYMLPFIFFFSIGTVPATMVTMVYAVPPLVRLTNLGIRQVPEDVVEASRAYGAPEMRVLRDVQLPLARQAIMTGLNQTLMMSIAMAGIAAIMGAGGLGRLVYRAIQNLDIAEAASSGLGFFIVAVVLDRLSQPEDSDSGNLLSRIIRAFAHRRDPELLLASVKEGAEKPVAETESNAPATVSERRGLGLSGLAGLVAIVSVFLTWGNNAGLLSGHVRYADLDLGGQSFGGLEASGGNWIGLFVLGLGVFLVLAAGTIIRRPETETRWLTPAGSVIAATAMIVVVVTYLMWRPATGTVNYSNGVGVYVALVAGILATIGSMHALWTAPYVSHRPLRQKVAWSRFAAGVFAVIVIGIGAISGWTFDQRQSDNLTTQQQWEVDMLMEDAKINPSKAALNNSKIASIINKARRTNLIVLDGLRAEGGGLGRLAIPVGIIGALLLLPAAGVFGLDEHLRWRWSVLVAGVGMGLILLALSWVVSLARVTDNKIVTGAGVFLTLVGGIVILSSSRSILGEFPRRKVYGDAVVDQVTR